MRRLFKHPVIGFRGLILLPGVLCALMAPIAAEAFVVESLVSQGCHERITSEAINAEGWPDAFPPLELSPLERLVVQGLPVGLADKVHHSTTLALIIGCRDNDLQGVRPNDLTALSKLHAKPEGQEAHCLRSPEEDGPVGDEDAIRRCRRFILDELELAHRSAEPTATASVSVWLAFDGQVEVELSRFGFHLGRALHGLQDSFSHCFRSPDGLRIQHVLNYVDWARGHDATLERDGHPHLSSLDLCDDQTAPRRHRVALALEASRALLKALYTDEPAQRRQRLEEVLDRYMTYQPGCTAGNNFCDAPEQFEAAGCGCAAAPTSPGPLIGVLLACLVLAFRRRQPRAAATAGGALILALLCGSAPAAADMLPVSGTARADQLVAARADQLVAARADQLVAARADQRGPTHPVPDPPAPPRAGGEPTPAPAEGGTGEEGRLALHLALGGALDEGALVFGLGLRWRTAHRWSAGVAVECNPWFSANAVRIAPGTLNVYASFAWRWINLAPLDLRSSAHAGASILLFDLVSAQAGSVGPYFGLSLLGIALHLSPRWNILLEPADVAIAIPSLTGVPLIYLQYRFTAAVQYIF